MKKNPCRNCVYFKSENMTIYPPTVICGRKIPIRGVNPENGCLWFKKAAREKPEKNTLSNSTLFKGIL